MKKITLLAFLFCAGRLVAGAPEKVDAHLTLGDPLYKSLGVLTFGPDNLLFAGDTMGAAILAIDVNDSTQDTTTTEIVVEDIDKKIAAMLGVKRTDIAINDMAVHPRSQKVYLSVTRLTGDQTLLVRADKTGAVEEVPLKGIRYARHELSNPVAADKKDRRGRPIRKHAITDIAFVNDSLYVAGLSNEEFASTFRMIPFPFKKNDKGASLEIFHGAHNAKETHAPIRTFVQAKIDGQDHLLAAYTCTPLVTFPISDLKPGAHVKGKTVAELGAGNRPLDMLAFSYDNKDYLLMSNSSRSLMRFNLSDVGKAEPISTGVESWSTAGVPYMTLPWPNIEELSRLNKEQFVVLMRKKDGGLDLDSATRKIIMGIWN